MVQVHKANINLIMPSVETVGFTEEHSPVGMEHCALSDVEFSPIGEEIVDGLEPLLKASYPGVFTDDLAFGGKVVAAAMSDSVTQVAGMGLCPDCGFVVKLVGHNFRCRPPSALPAYIANLAYVGDACWEHFVRRTVICMKLPRETASPFTSNQFFASFLEEIVGIADLGRKPAPNASVHSRATYVKALLAVSAKCRIRVAELAGKEFKKFAPMLWRHSMVVELENDMSYVPTPSMDGYCYLDLFEEVEHKKHAQLYKAYPKWGDVLKKLFGQHAGVMFYLSLDGIYHISKTHYHGMRRFEGRYVDLPFNKRSRVGGQKTVNFTRSVNLRGDIGVGLEWPLDVRTKANTIFAAVRSLKSTGRDVMCTARFWDRFQGFYASVDTDGLVKMRGTLTQGVNAIVAIMQLAHLPSAVIGTSGVFTCVSTLDNLGDTIPVGGSWLTPGNGDNLDEDAGLSDFSFYSDSIGENDDSE